MGNLISIFCPKESVYVALFDYEKVQTNQLTIQKGDQFKVLDAVCVDWLRVRSLSNSQEGLVPAHYLADENTLEAEE